MNLYNTIQNREASGQKLNGVCKRLYGLFGEDKKKSFLEAQLKGKKETIFQLRMQRQETTQ